MAATNVHFQFKDAQGKPKTGMLRISPVRRHMSGATVIVLGGFETQLAADGTSTVALDPTDNTFAWKVEEFPDDTDCAFTRFVQVPASSGTVEYTSLTDVDESTLAPTLNKGAALTYLLASSLQEAQTLSAANPGQMVFYPESASKKTVASQILEDLTGARAVVESQSAQAAQAANVAQAAASQVAAQAQSVQTAADAISESKATVESHSDAALTAIDEAVKQVQDKASDAAVDTEPSSGTTDEAPADTDSTSGVSQED